MLSHTNFNASSSSSNTEAKKDMLSNLWNPPLSLQRRTVYVSPKQSYKQYFPLELTAKDYLRRVFDILADGIRSHTSKMFDEMSESSPSISSASKSTFNELLPPQANLYIILHNILGDITFRSGNSEPQVINAAEIIANKLGLQSADTLISCAETLLVCSSQILDQKIDSCRLGKLPVLFEAARALLHCFGGSEQGSMAAKRLEASLAINPTLSGKTDDFLSDADVSYYNLVNLEAQLEAHASFKEQRMRMLGWVWATEDIFQSNGADLVTGIMAQPGAGDAVGEAETKRASSKSSSLEVAKELLFQLDALLEPRAAANSSLINALTAAAKDIDQLSAEVGSADDFLEAGRLKALADAISVTVDARARQLLDSVRHICRQAHHTASDLLLEAETCKRTNQFSRIEELETAAKELSRARTALRNSIQLESLLDSTPLGELVRLENNTSCITADSVFSVPLGGNLTIGALVIRAGANAILESIKRWPGFSLLNTQQGAQNSSTTNMSYSDPLPVPTIQAASFRRIPTDIPPPPPSLSNMRTISSNASVGSAASSYNASTTSPGRRSRPLSATRTRSKSPSAVSVTSERPRSVSRNQRSSSPGRLRGRLQSNRDDSNESVASFSSHGHSIGSRGSVGQGFLRSSGQQVWDVDAVQEVRTRGAAAFAEGEELLKTLHVLGEVSSVAHTKLLLRLIGLCGDLVKLRTMAEFSGRMAEATRLAVLCGCVEATIDADCLDQNVFGGRSRKRLDFCRDVSIQAAELLSSLQKISADSHAVRDFSGKQQLDSLSGELNRAKELLDISMVEFSIVQTTQEQGSYWDSHLEDKLSSEGSEFVTADFLLKYVDAYEGHSVGSLAVVAGAGAILTDIRHHWIGLTALGSSGGRPNDEDSALNRGADGWNPIFDKINFADARSLRILGFSIQELKAAGFSDVDILTSGFPPSALRDSGYDPTALREFNITGWDNALKPLRSDVNVEKSALEVIFSNTSGDSWHCKTGWKDLIAFDLNSNTIANDGTRGMVNRQLNIQTVLSRANGIACNGSLQVTKLTLPNNNLKGILPTSIGSLSNLVQLVLNGNKLSGHIPDSIGLLSSLTTLYLHDNFLVGEIPVAIKGLRSLIVLRLDNNKLSGRLPSSLCQLANLRRLVLNNNQFSGPLHSRFTDLRDLQQLVLSNNKFSGPIPEWIGSLTGLNTLHLDGNLFSGTIPGTLEQLTNLTSLNLRSNPSLVVDNFRLQHKLNRCLIKFDKPF